MEEYGGCGVLKEPVGDPPDLIESGCCVTEQRGEPGLKSWESIEVSGAIGVETLNCVAQHLSRSDVVGHQRTQGLPSAF